MEFARRAVEPNHSSFTQENCKTNKPCDLSQLQKNNLLRLFFKHLRDGQEFQPPRYGHFLLTVMVEKTAWQNGLIETGTTLINQGGCSEANTSINRLT